MLSVPDFRNPLGNNLYKVVLSLESLNPVLDQIVKEKSQRVRRLHVSSVPGEVRMEGEANPRKDSPARKFGIDRIGFRIHVRVRESRGNDVILRVQRIEIWNAQARKIDLLKIVGRFSARLRATLIQEITEVIPEVITVGHYAGELVFHAGYFVSMVPTLWNSLGSIHIAGVRAADVNHVHFYVQSNLLLLGMVDFFGPQYLSLEQIQGESDSLRMLWDG